MTIPLRPLAVRPEDLVPRRPPPAAAPAAGKADLKQAATAFEGMMLSLMLQSMRRTVQPSGLLGDSGQARGSLEYLLDQAVVDAAMKGGRSLGLAARLEAAWKAREAAPESKERPTGQVAPPAGR